MTCGGKERNDETENDCRGVDCGGASDGRVGGRPIPHHPTLLAHLDQRVVDFGDAHLTKATFRLAVDRHILGVADQTLAVLGDPVRFHAVAHPPHSDQYDQNDHEPYVFHCYSMADGTLGECSAAWESGAFVRECARDVARRKL